MPILTAKGLSKAFGAAPLFSDIDLAIARGERIGLVGANGTGKSTLAKILAGLEHSDSGELALRRGAKVAYLEQDPSFDPSKSALEIVSSGLREWRGVLDRLERVAAALKDGDGDLDSLLEEQAALTEELERLGGWDRDHEARSTLNQLGVADAERAVGGMSGGELRRVALARLLISRPDLAILDEPTNHLDIETIEWLEQHLNDRFEGAILLISHDRYFIDAVVDRVLEIARDGVFSYEGGWFEYLEGKAEREAQQARAESNRQNFLRTELEWLRRSPKARTTKSKSRVDRAKAAIAAKPSGGRAALRIQAMTERSGNRIVEIEDLKLEIAGRTLLEGFSLHMVKGDRIGIVGPNGAGKTTLLEAIAGSFVPAGGKIVLGKRTELVYLDQKRSGLIDEENIFENVGGGRERVDFNGRAMDLRSYLARFQFSPEEVRKPVAALSGGERARVALAKLLLRPANLFLFDEPTNDLDAMTLGALEQSLLDLDANAFIVSHDRHFLDRVATHILELDGEGNATLYVGDYSTYRALKKDAEGAKRAREATNEAPAVKAGTQAKPAAPAAQKRKSGLTYGEEIELGKLMPEIEALEVKLAELEEALCDPAVYEGTGEKGAALAAERDEKAAVLETKMERWMELEEKKGGVV